MLKNVEEEIIEPARRPDREGQQCGGSQRWGFE